MRPCCRNFKLRPILECVFPCGVGRFTAVFGYQNDEGRTLVLPAGGPDNFFRPAPRRRGQPSRFLPGRHRNVFSVHGINAITWTLGNRTLRARPDFAPCETDFAATDAPLALLPVRIETRFFPFDQTPTELLIRIYPDDIHVDSHEPGLTADEQEFGVAFWADFGAPGDGEEAEQRRRQAWAVLADRYSARRAAWIARVLAPNAPAPGARDSSWTRAATTEALPTRWVALGYRGAQRIFAAWGERLPTVLQVGPSPDPTPSDDGVEPEIKWMSDFDEAQRVGMGIRVPLTGDTTLGFDRVVVLGSQGGCDRHRGGELLASLLNGHHYTTGLALIPQTTPTNNSEDAPSGFSSQDPGHARSYAAERGDPLFEPTDGRDGDVLSSLLGLRPETFFHVEGADAFDQEDARSMNAALWEATLGYFFKQWLPGTASDTELAVLRRHFIDNVRSRGPLPLLRASRQPYGILPTTSVDRFKPLEPGAVLSPGFTRARTQLTFMRTIWNASVPFIPRVGTAADAAAALEQLVRTLSMEPVSGGIEGRFVFGQRYVTFVNDFLGKWNDSIFGSLIRILFTAATFFQEIANTVLAVFTQLANNVPILGATYAPQPFALTYALTGTTPATPEELARQPSGAVSATEPYAADLNVFTAVGSQTYQQLRQFAWPAAAGITALLPRLVRNAKLLEYSAISGALQVQRGLIAPSAVRDPELVDVGTTGTRTRGRLLDDVIPGVTAPATVGDYLDTLTLPPATAPAADPQLANLLEFLGAAAHLEERPTAALDLVFRELMDLCSHRIDAWMTSIATARIRELRKKAPDGLYLGGYGWVENLKPSIRQSKPEGGFLLAPSLNHAAAAAILRNGRLSNNPTAVDRAFAVDLSSRRVRLARALADGIRQGSSLAAMLGYELERGLRENHPGLFLQAILPDLRALAPLAINKIPDHEPVGGTPSIDSLGARNVVDGLQARDLFHNGGLDTLLAGLTADQQAAVAAEIARLDDMVDALGDLSLSESIYQLAIGNHERAAAAMNAFGQADVAPPQFQVLETPRTGFANTHRLTVLMTGAATVPPSWGPGGATTARAKAEPQLNAWTAKLLGDPSRVEARVDFLDNAGQPLTPPVSASVQLSDLGLAPLDVLAIARPGEAGSPSEIERLWSNRIMSPPPTGVPADAVLRFDFGRDAAWEPSRVSVGELFELARRIRELHGAARALTAEDLATPADDEPSGFDLTELAGRADVAFAALQAATSALAAIDPETATLAAIRSAVQALFPFGVPGAIPVLPAADETTERALLGKQVPFVLKEAQRRVDKHAALVAAVEPTLPTLPAERIAAYHEDRLKTVFGAGFRALARLTPANAAVLVQAAAAGQATQAATPFAALTWFQRIARVRDGAGKLDDVLFYAETLGTGDAPQLQILQLPVEADDPWIGLPLPAGRTPKAGRFSIVAHAPNGPLDLSGPVSGLTIDQWVEVIPNIEETAGVAFHYDRPNSTAPQAILLAVTPVPQALWDLDSLEAVVLETLNLAKIRAVDPHVIRGAGHVLPALYFAHNLAHDTISLSTSSTP
jgi:hypothetical protein